MPNTHLTAEFKKELSEHYFLFSRTSFFAVFAAALVAMGIVSYGGAHAAIAAWAGSEAEERLEAADKIASRLISLGDEIPSNALVMLENERLVPEGAIVLLGRDRNCPTAWEEIATTMILLNDAVAMNNEATQRVTRGRSGLEPTGGWRGYQFTACTTVNN